MSRIIKPAIVLGAVMALSATVAVATGAIPSSNGTVSACVQKSGGVVRFIDKEKGDSCISTIETPVTLNEQGPKGDPGAPGAPGPKGDKGDTGDPGPAGGLGNGFFAGDTNSRKIDVGAATTVLAKTVPAGRYLVWVKLTLIGIKDDWFARCQLVDGGALLDGDVIANEIGSAATMALMVPSSSTSEQKLAVRCDVPTATDPPYFVNRVQLMAVPVDSVG